MRVKAGGVSTPMIAWTRALALPALSALLVTGLMGWPASMALANDIPLFAGVTGIIAKSGPDHSQLIEFQADSPFQYQLQVLDANRIVLRLYNARLSGAMLGQQGEVRVIAGGVVQSAVVKMPDPANLFSEEYQEIILTGPGLGQRRIRVKGATELALDLPKIAPQIPNDIVLDELDDERGAVDKAAPALRPMKIATGTPAPSSPARRAKGQAKPVVTFPNLETLVKAPEKEAPVALAHAAGQEAVALLGAEKTPSRIEAAQTEAPDQASVLPRGQNAERSSGPRIAAITQGARFNPDRLADRSASPMVMPQFTEPETGYPRPNIQAPWYQGSQVSQGAQADPNYAGAYPPDLTAEAPEPGYQALMALPRYRGGAAPIQAVTLDPQGRPVTLVPKGTSLGEVDLQAGNGGYNTLFQAESENTLGRLTADALSQYRSGNYERALATLQQALVQDSANGDLYAALAEVYVKLSRLTEAEKAYQKAVQLSEGKYDQRYAQVLALSGKRIEAIDRLEKLYRANPKQAQVAYMLGTLHEELGHTTEALAYLKQAADLHPASADIQYNLGLAYELSGNLEAARKHYQKAMALNPSAHDASMGLERVGR